MRQINSNAWKRRSLKVSILLAFILISFLAFGEVFGYASFYVSALPFWNSALFFMVMGSPAVAMAIFGLINRRGLRLGLTLIAELCILLLDILLIHLANS